MKSISYHHVTTTTPPGVIQSYFIKVHHIFPLPKETYGSSCFFLATWCHNLCTCRIYAAVSSESLAHSRGQNKHCALTAKSSATLALFFSFFRWAIYFITAVMYCLFAIGSDRRRHTDRHTHTLIYICIYLNTHNLTMFMHIFIHITTYA